MNRSFTRRRLDGRRRPEILRGRRSPRVIPDRVTTVIIVLDAHDVIFAEITAGLDLDQFQIDLAGIFKTVPGPDRNINRFVLMQS